MSFGEAIKEWVVVYGWAIVVILAAIGALAYFGVLTPKSFGVNPSPPQNASCLQWNCAFVDDAPLTIAITTTGHTCAEAFGQSKVKEETCANRS